MKYLLFLLISILCLISNIRAQDPAIVMATSKTAGVPFKFFIGTGSAGSTIKVDFGDGILVDKIVGTGDTVKGTLGSAKVVKIYGAGINSFECVNMRLTSLNVTNCPTLVKFWCNDNYLTSLDVTKCSLLSSFRCYRNSITSLDLTQCKALTELHVGVNQISELDVTKCTSLKLLGCHDLLLSTLDITNCPLTYLLCYNNKLNFASIPLKKASMTTYTYAGQLPMNIATVYSTGIVDLSSQANINGNATTYVWKTESGATLVNGSDYSISGGITTFLKKQTEKVYCEMTNATFPAFTSSAPLKTTLTTVNVNEAPVINNQTFSVLEGATNGTAVGKVIASDPDANSLTYSFTSGNISDAFSINASTGDISVKTSTALDYEALSTYALIVKVQDNGTGTLFSSATITINLTDKNEAPIISNQSFSVIEAAPNGTVVGKIIGSDPDADVLTYSIISGNTSDAFAVNATTGIITVNTSTALNYEVLSSYALTIKIQDNGALSNTATITINVTDKNEAPLINDQTFSIKESSTNGTVVGTVSASDPDGDLLTYSIVSGNTLDAFAINATTGVITVKTAAALNCESLPSYALAIKVQDNGVGVLSNSATITVNLTDKNQTPLIGNQTFSISEKMSDGSFVGKVLASDPDGGTLTYSIVSGNTSDAFAIDAVTGEITVKTSTVLSYKSLSAYALTVKVQDNGVGTLSNSAIIIINLTGPTGIYSIYSGKANCVYPNPSKGVININPDLLSKGDLKIKIIDLNGKLVLERTNISPGESFEINQPGLFIIILSVNNEEFSQKVFIQK